MKEERSRDRDSDRESRERGRKETLIIKCTVMDFFNA